MSDYKVSLKDAISDYQLNSGKVNFKDIGEGSFFSWKVTVLLHKDGKWKFEDANLFKRILWKLEKLIAPFKNSDEFYAKVDLGKIKKALENIQDKSGEVGALENRVNELMKKKGPASKEREVHVEEFPPLDQNSYPVDQARPDVKTQDQLNLPKGFEWLNVKIPANAKNLRLDGNRVKYDIGEKTIQIDMWPGHSEWENIKDFLGVPETQIVCVSQVENKNPTSVDVFVKTDDGKIKRYPSTAIPNISNPKSLLYKEYDSLETALADYAPNDQEFSYLKSLRELREIINGQEPGINPKNSAFIQPRIRALVGEFLGREGIPDQEFLKNILEDPNFNKERDLLQIDKAIEGAFERSHALEDKK